MIDSLSLSFEQKMIGDRDFCRTCWNEVNYPRLKRVGLHFQFSLRGWFPMRRLPKQQRSAIGWLTSACETYPAIPLVVAGAACFWQRVCARFNPPCRQSRAGGSDASPDGMPKANRLSPLLHGVPKPPVDSELQYCWYDWLFKTRSHPKAKAKGFPAHHRINTSKRENSSCRSRSNQAKCIYL